MNFFDTTNNTFLNPVTGKTVHYKKMVAEMGDGRTTKTLHIDLGSDYHSSLFNVIFTQCLGMDRWETIRTMKEKGVGKFYITPQIYDKSRWDLTFLPGDLEPVIEIVDKMLTEKFGDVPEKYEMIPSDNQNISMKMNYFDTTNNIFHDPVDNEDIPYTALHVQYDSSNSLSLRYRDNHFKGLYGVIFEKCLGFENVDDVAGFLKSKGLTHVAVMHSAICPNLAALRDEFPTFLRIIDDALTEKFINHTNLLDRKHRLAGHVRLEFE